MSRSTLSDLRAIVRSIESDAPADSRVLPFGIERMDRAIAGGGLRIDGLHEVAGEGSGWGDDSAALLFIAGIVARTAGQVLWVLRSRDLFAPGLYQAGLDPARVIYAEARSDTEVLALLEEGLRHRGLGAVVGEASPFSACRRSSPSPWKASALASFSSAASGTPQRRHMSSAERNGPEARAAQMRTAWLSASPWTILKPSRSGSSPRPSPCASTSPSSRVSVAHSRARARNRARRRSAGERGGLSPALPSTHRRWLR